MTELVAVPLEGGGEIVVEMDHAQAGAVIAKTASECPLKVTLRWERGDDAAG
ncbi:MAG: hypothetical protein JO115_12595 [Pseudonocardiales bacterium]|nr:hypothetical protein [Pseudonocardiales bacterium]MBV9141735.1 hypothetical protein [Pseudonocardiales bacterium]